MTCLISCSDHNDLDLNFLSNKNKDPVLYENTCTDIIGYKNYRNFRVNGLFRRNDNTLSLNT